MLIEHWVLKNETYLMTSKLPVERIFGYILRNVSLKYLNEISLYIQYDYPEFRKNLSKVYGKPDSFHSKT